MENFQKYIVQLQEKLNYLRNSWSTMAEGSKKFELMKDIERLEIEIRDEKRKLEGRKHGLSTKYYPYTCDRVDQRDTFIDSNLSSKTRKVHFFYLHGETPQSHKGMFKRFHYEMKSVNVKKSSPGNYELHDYPIINESNKESIYKKEILEALFRYFGLDINDYSHLSLDQLRLKHICDDSPALNGYSAENHVALMFFIVSSAWKPFTKNLIRWFIRTFCDPAVLPDQAPNFFFFLSIAYKEKEKQGLLSRLFSKDNISPRERLKKVAKEIDEVVFLPELTEVVKDDVDTWFTKTNLNLLATQKDNIYQKFFNTTGPFDMEDVIEGLNEAIIKHNENLLANEKI